MSDQPARFGFRGYIGSRSIQGTTYPQRIQNLTVRDYTARISGNYKLSATEYAMSGCYLVLAAILDELPHLEGIIAFSCFMLPKRKARRLGVYARVLASGAQLHAALENLPLRSADDIARWEDVIDVAATLFATPFAGRYEKSGKPLDSILAKKLSM